MITTRQAQKQDYPQILALQKENTPKNLSDEQKKQGFIVSAMDEKLLDSINQKLGVLVACEGEYVVGFVCLSATNQQPRPRIIDVLLEQLQQVRLFGENIVEENAFLYGPVCIAAHYRGRGILHLLFSAVKLHLADHYAVGHNTTGLAFINSNNPHSLNAHIHGLGMTDVLVFSFAGEEYHLVVFTLS